MKFNQEDLSKVKEQYESGAKFEGGRIEGVEIFATGKWNGKKITEADLDAIMESYNATKDTVRPFLKLGHNEDQQLLKQDGLPAAGWVENMRREGSKIVADFVDIPKKIYQLIKNKAYRKVSVELYNNLDFQGKKLKKMIGAVALLGSDLPGVLNLDDLLSLYCCNQQFSTVEKFDSQKNIDTIEIGQDDPTHKEDDMPTELEKLQFKLEQAEQEKADLAAKIKDGDKAAEKYKADIEAANQAKEAAEAKLLEAQAAEKAAKVEKFVTELQAEKLCSKAMAPMVSELLGDEKETYSHGEKEVSKFELVQEILKASKEAAKVNFSETTGDVKDGKDKGLTPEKIEAYAAEHKIDFSAAYRQLSKENKA